MDVNGAIGALDDWLESMRQPNGYGGPVSHWWQSCFQFTGPGLDWRYEGLLTGYSQLWQKTGNFRWRNRVFGAASDLIDAQLPEGNYPNSRFEANPGTLGTPHEAAASLGLMRSVPVLGPSKIVSAVERNMDYLISQLWDEETGGFNDRPGVPGRVPNKLATLAEGLLLGAQITGRSKWLTLAQSALDDVLQLQVSKGPLRGGVHQWGRGRHRRGDGRFFPYYNARCIPALVQGAITFERSQYREAADSIGDFLERVRNADGTWPQLIYESGRRVEYPHWVAASADILHAYWVLGRKFPEGALERLYHGQLASGGFITAEGFRRRFDSRANREAVDIYDLVPVVGWNDKVLRLLTEIQQNPMPMPSREPLTIACTRRIFVGHHSGRYLETRDRMSIVLDNGRVVFDWMKGEPWSRTEGEVLVR